MATPQWYQIPNLVTASMKLKGIFPDKIQGAVLVQCVHQWKVSHLMSTCYPLPPFIDTPSSHSPSLLYLCVRGYIY